LYDLIKVLKLVFLQHIEQFPPVEYLLACSPLSRIISPDAFELEIQYRKTFAEDNIINWLKQQGADIGI
jgi:hypothetical protein